MLVVKIRESSTTTSSPKTGTTDTKEPPKPPALVSPTSYDLMWTDQGSGADWNGAFWEPVAPKGYVALGLVCTCWKGKTAVAPKPDAVRCVRDDLTARGHAGVSIWNDEGTGKKGRFSVWAVVPMSGTNDNTVYIGPGTFCASLSYLPPAASNVFHVLKLNLPETIKPGTWQAPKLVLEDPSNTEVPSGVYEQRIPFPLIADPVLRPARQLSESPIYILRRTDTWKRRAGVSNRSDSIQNFSEDVGVTNESSSTQSFATSLGATASVEASAYGFGGSVGMSYTETWERSTHLGISVSSTTHYSVNAEPHTVIFFWVLDSKFELLRTDGSLVNDAAIHVQGGLEAENAGVAYDSIPVSLYDEYMNKQNQKA